MLAFPYPCAAHRAAKPQGSKSRHHPFEQPQDMSRLWLLKN